MRTLLRREGLEIVEVACRHPRGRGQLTEQARGQVVVFVRRGCFVRRANGVETLLDPTVAYCMNDGEEQRYDHPHDHGDDCTSLLFDPDLLAQLWGGEVTLPAGPLFLSPAIDLEHRLLLAAARRGADAHQLVEGTIALTAGLLERAQPERVASGRPATARVRRALVEGTREALAANPGTPLRELARALAVSPHHLSRIFASATGHTISRHRMRLRVRAALERMACGERDLGRLAAELDFADHSHLCRVVRSETGRTPSALRRALS
jgi:AraC-like DNA-binding protein